MFAPAVLHRVVRVDLVDVGSNVFEVVRDIAMAQVEGRCSAEGYVRPGSTEVLSVARGVPARQNMFRHVEYSLSLRASVCNPAPGLVVQALVRSVNRFGARCEAGFFDDTGAMVPVLDIVVVHNMPSVANERDPTELRPGDAVSVEILGRRFEVSDPVVSAFGRILAEGSAPAAPGEGQDSEAADEGGEDVDGEDEDDVDSVDAESAGDPGTEEGSSDASEREDSEGEVDDEDEDDGQRSAGGGASSEDDDVSAYRNAGELSDQDGP